MLVPYKDKRPDSTGFSLVESTTHLNVSIHDYMDGVCSLSYHSPIVGYCNAMSDVMNADDLHEQYSAFNSLLGRNPATPRALVDYHKTVRSVDSAFRSLRDAERKDTLVLMWKLTQLSRLFDSYLKQVVPVDPVIGEWFIADDEGKYLSAVSKNKDRTDALIADMAKRYGPQRHDDVVVADVAMGRFEYAAPL